MSSNRVSIVIPVKNGVRYLPEALEGICRQGVGADIIVVDDGSTDSTREYAISRGCTVVSHDVSQGPVKAKNAGLALLKTEFVMFHDHDDIMHDGVLKRMVDELDRHPEAMAVQFQSRDFISPDIPLEEAAKIVAKKDPYFGLFSGTTLMRSVVWDTLQRFDESVRAGEFLDWMTRMQSNGFKILRFEEATVDRRLHMTNFGRTDRNVEYSDYAKLIRMRLMAKAAVARKV